MVELAFRVRWSGFRRSGDLGSRADRILVYVQALAEGTEEDVRC